MANFNIRFETRNLDVKPIFVISSSLGRFPAGKQSEKREREGVLFAFESSRPGEFDALLQVTSLRLDGVFSYRLPGHQCDT